MDRSPIQPTIDFFNSIASRWDSLEDLPALRKKLDTGIRHFGVLPDEHILDVGCGTGNLTAALLRHLSGSGRVTAVDISPEMISVARNKISDSRVEWIVRPVERLDRPAMPYDRIFCCSVWPHFHDGLNIAIRLHGLLSDEGAFHLWHPMSREAVNSIHREAADAVRGHLLVPVAQTAGLLSKAGFHIMETQDDENGYLVTAGKEKNAG